MELKHKQNGRSPSDTQSGCRQNSVIEIKVQLGGRKPGPGRALTLIKLQKRFVKMVGVTPALLEEPYPSSGGRFGSDFMGQSIMGPSDLVLVVHG